MPSKEALMVHTVMALAEGCGSCGLSDDASEWFFKTYSPWIDTPQPKAGNKTPQEVWDTEGKNFLSHFKAIGARAKELSGSGVIDQSALQAGAREVQGGLKCPYCPDI